MADEVVSPGETAAAYITSMWPMVGVSLLMSGKFLSAH